MRADIPEWKIKLLQKKNEKEGLRQHMYIRNPGVKTNGSNFLSPKKVSYDHVSSSNLNNKHLQCSENNNPNSRAHNHHQAVNFYEKDGNFAKQTAPSTEHLPLLKENPILVSDMQNKQKRLSLNIDSRSYNPIFEELARDMQDDKDKKNKIDGSNNHEVTENHVGTVCKSGGGGWQDEIKYGRGFVEKLLKRFNELISTRGSEGFRGVVRWRSMGRIETVSKTPNRSNSLVNLRAPKVRRATSAAVVTAGSGRSKSGEKKDEVMQINVISAVNVPTDCPDSLAHDTFVNHRNNTMPKANKMYNNNNNNNNNNNHNNNHNHNNHSNSKLNKKNVNNMDKNMNSNNKTMTFNEKSPSARLSTNSENIMNIANCKETTTFHDTSRPLKTKNWNSSELSCETDGHVKPFEVKNFEERRSKLSKNKSKLNKVDNTDDLFIGDLPRVNQVKLTKSIFETSSWDRHPGSELQSGDMKAFFSRSKKHDEKKQMTGENVVNSNDHNSKINHSSTTTNNKSDNNNTNITNSSNSKSNKISSSISNSTKTTHKSNNKNKTSESTDHKKDTKITTNIDDDVASCDKDKTVGNKDKTIESKDKADCNKTSNNSPTKTKQQLLPDLLTSSIPSKSPDNTHSKKHHNDKHTHKKKHNDEKNNNNKSNSNYNNNKSNHNNNNSNHNNNNSNHNNNNSNHNNGNDNHNNIKEKKTKNDVDATVSKDKMSANEDSNQYSPIIVADDSNMSSMKFANNPNSNDVNKMENENDINNKNNQNNLNIKSENDNNSMNNNKINNNNNNNNNNPNNQNSMNSVKKNSGASREDSRASRSNRPGKMVFKNSSNVTAFPLQPYQDIRNNKNKNNDDKNNNANKNSDGRNRKQDYDDDDAEIVSSVDDESDNVTVTNLDKVLRNNTNNNNKNIHKNKNSTFYSSSGSKNPKHDHKKPSSSNSNITSNDKNSNITSNDNNDKTSFSVRSRNHSPPPTSFTSPSSQHGESNGSLEKGSSKL